MPSLVRAKLYPAVKSKSFVIFLAVMVVWAVSAVLSLCSSRYVDKDSAFFYFTFFETYMQFLPIGVASWYGIFKKNHCSYNIAFQVEDKKTLASGIVAAHVMQLAFLAALTILGLLICGLPGFSWEVSSIRTFGKLVMLICLMSICRTSTTVFFTELLRSRLGGALLGLGFSTGFFQLFLLDSEVRLCYFLHITETSFPLTSNTPYLMFYNLRDAGHSHITFEAVPFLLSALLLLVYTAIFTGLTLRLVFKRDIE